MARVLINFPPRAKRGEIIEIKTLIQHPMETGYRLDNKGAVMPRDIISRFTCAYNGEQVFRAELFPAISANPFIAFSTVATESGELVFSWIDDDNGQIQSEIRQITVE
jgi:sulfur-oxidizing protein SoxZ